jgi:ankyrin repeat protein
VESEEWKVEWRVEKVEWTNDVIEIKLAVVRCSLIASGNHVSPPALVTDMKDSQRTTPLHLACTMCYDRNEMNTHSSRGVVVVVNTVTTTPKQFASMAATLFKDVEDVQSEVGACSIYRVALIALLVAEGADMNMFHGGGMSPLSLACRHGLIGVVELLLGHGVDINLAGRCGKTALSIACILN